MWESVLEKGVCSGGSCPWRDLATHTGHSPTLCSCPHSVPHELLTTSANKWQVGVKDEAGWGWARIRSKHRLGRGLRGERQFPTTHQKWLPPKAPSRRNIAGCVCTRVNAPPPALPLAPSLALLIQRLETRLVEGRKQNTNPLKSSGQTLVTALPGARVPRSCPQKPLTLTIPPPCSAVARRS